MPFKFNPFLGNFDQVVSDAHILQIAKGGAAEVVRSIPTSNTNAMGNTNFYYDHVTCSWVEAGPIPVTDENGNIIVEDDGT
jgi:hypothetical protein